MHQGGARIRTVEDAHRHIPEWPPKRSRASTHVDHDGPFERAFDEPETYACVCEIHPGQMQGTVVVDR